MKKTIQTKLHNPPNQNGNCLAAALDCFIDCGIENIPTFEDMMDHKIETENSPSWVTACSRFLNKKGWEWGSLDGHTDGYYLVIGKTVRGFDHICVYKDGKLWHDPHPSNSGLVTETHFEYLIKQ